MSRRKHRPAKIFITVPDEQPVRNKTVFTEVFAVKAVIVIQLLFLAAEFVPELSTNGDDAKYFILSKALAHGQGYRDIYMPGSPAHGVFPVLFPLMITITSSVSTNPLLPKLLMGILSILSLLILYRIMHRYMPLLALPVLIITAASYTISHFSTALMSETAYLFATLAALYLFEKSKERNNLLFLIAAVTVAVFPVQIRTIGITFSVAFIMESLFEKRFKYALAHFIVLCAVLAAIKLMVHSDTGYLTALLQQDNYDPERGNITAHDFLVRIVKNLQLYAFTLYPTAFTGYDCDGHIWNLFGALLSTVTLTAIVYGLFLRSRFLSFYIVSYLGVLVLSQEKWANTRYILPVLPFMYYYFLLGIKLLYQWARKLKTAKKTEPIRRLLHTSTPFSHGILWTAAGIFVFVNILARFYAMDKQATTSDWRNFNSCADWVRLNAPKNAVVVSRKPELFYVRSKHRGFVYPFSHDVEKVIDGIRKGGAKYVVLDNFFWTATSARYLYPAIMSHPERFKIVYSLRNPDTFILEFLSE